MTTFNYNLVLDDNESIMMSAALELMIKHCEDQIKTKPESHFSFLLESAIAVKSRMYSNTVQMSGNNFWTYDDETPKKITILF